MTKYTIKWRILEKLFDTLDDAMNHYNVNDSDEWFWKSYSIEVHHG